METKRRPSDVEAISLELVSGLLMLIGLAAFAFLFISINTDEAIKEATRNDDSVLLAFLDSFGITLPVIAIVLGGIIFWLGVRLRQRRIDAARWAQVAYIWMIVACVGGAIGAFMSGGKSGSALVKQPFQYDDALISTIPFLLAIVPLYIALRWLNNVVDIIFEGEETLGSASSRVAWNLLIPTMVVLVLVAARPLEETFITSLTDKRFAGTEEVNFIGLDNYKQLLSFRFDTVECRKEEGADDCTLQRDGSVRWESIDREKLQEGYRTADVVSISSSKGIAMSGKDADFLNAIKNTLQFTFFSVILELFLGLMIALIVNAKFAGRGLMRTAMLVPWAIPTVVSARLWETMLRDNQSGIFNKIALDLGFIEQSKAWLATDSLMMPAIVMVDVWKTAPFMALLILAGLQTIPGEYYEAASVDGASRVRQFFSITLPLLRPIIAVALVFRTLDALRAFDVFNVLLSDRMDSMATYNHQQLIAFQNGGYASAIGVIIFAIILIFTVIYVRSLGIETD